MKKQIPAERCENCKNFVQHYRREEEVKVRYVSVYAGHCVSRRVKDCEPLREACDTWEQKFY